MLIGLFRACSHRYNRKQLFQHYSTRLCSACAVLGTGFSGTQSGPDQGGRTFPIGLIDQKQERLLHKAMFHISLSGSKTKSVFPLLKIHSYCTFYLNLMLSFASINHLFFVCIFFTLLLINGNSTKIMSRNIM